MTRLWRYAMHGRGFTVFDRARGWDSRPAGPGSGTGRDRAGVNRAGFIGAGFNGAGFNGAAGNSAGGNGAGLDGVGGNGGRLSSAGWNGTWNGTAARAAGPAETVVAPAVALGLTHRIYPDGRAVAVIHGELGTGPRADKGVRVHPPGHRPKPRAGPPRRGRSDVLRRPWAAHDGRGWPRTRGRRAASSAWSRPAPLLSRSCVSRGWMRTSRSCASRAPTSPSPE